MGVHFEADVDISNCTFCKKYAGMPFYMIDGRYAWEKLPACVSCMEKLPEDVRKKLNPVKYGAESWGAETSSDLDCSFCGISGEEREGEPLCSRCLGCFECCETLFDKGQHKVFETDWERGEYDPTADVVDITADPIRNRVYVTVRFYTKGGLSSHDVIYTGDLKHSGAADLVLDSESYTNPITGQPNFVLVTEDIRDGEYERYEYFVIDAESEAKMSDREILEWQYGEGSVEETGYGDSEFWVHGERIHALEFQPISLSDALVLERLRIASRNYPYQDLSRKEAETSETEVQKTLVAIDLIHESAEYCDYFIIPTTKLSGFDEQEIVSYFYDLDEEDWDEDGTSFSSFMSFPTEVSSVMTWSITPEEEKVLNKFGIR